MPKVTIDGTEIEVPAGITVLQACEMAGQEIPRFCYHERLAIAGNCRMCLVQIEGGPPKPAASCAMPIADGMKVHTNTPMVKKAREGVMEFLLINHPLDCPICDQGGECDLQDQAMAYGRGNNRFAENKRAVKDKYMGPLIKTHMTRCIHCTRCIRFSTDVAGVEELGAVGRGEHMEVTTYVEKAISSELSGNLVDICPVGALTSKPYAFKARSWELGKTETIDVLDAVGSNITVNTRGLEVMRVLPRLNEDINEEWISDKTRFAYDGLKMQRLDQPMIKKNGTFEKVSWEVAYATIAERLKSVSPQRIAALAGNLCDVESMFALKELWQKLGSPHLDCRQDGALLDASVRSSYLFNTTIAGIEKADLCLLIGANPRYEATMVNTRLRKRFLKGGFTVASIGAPCDLTYPVEHLGDSLEKLQLIVQGTHPFVKKIEAAQYPMIIIGPAALSREDSAEVLGICRRIVEKFGFVKEEWNGYNVLHYAAARVGGLDLQFVPQNHGKTTQEILKASAQGELECLYLLGADEIDFNALGKTFIIYQGHHGDKGAHHADVILPGAAYTEKNATYVNTEGRVQRAKAASFPPGQAKEDWRIIVELAMVMGQTMPYETLSQLRAKVGSVFPHLAAVNQITPAPWGEFGVMGKVLSDPLLPFFKNYYMTDPISRASKIMAECTKLLLNHLDKKVA